MFNAKAYSAASATSPLASRTIRRRNPTDDDVQIEILFCGKKVGVVGLGADEVVVSRNADEMKKRGGCSSPM